MVAEVAYLWVAQQLLPTASRDSSVAHLLAATRRTRRRSRDLHSTYTESADPDEPAVGQCH
jgi:hypothetical protein